MSKPEDILEQGFELAPETTTPAAPSVTETLVARLEDRFRVDVIAETYSGHANAGSVIRGSDAVRSTEH